jgi:hypothetical protein
MPPRHEDAKFLSFLVTDVTQNLRLSIFDANLTHIFFSTKVIPLRGSMRLITSERYNLCRKYKGDNFSIGDAQP